jgi:hypothetical protein
METNHARLANRPGILWYQFRITLKSRLPPEKVRERLNNALPEFDVRSGQRVVRPNISFPTSYVGSFVGEWTFGLSGPVKYNASSDLHVSGTIEENEQGSLIRLTANNFMSFFYAGIIWIVALVFIGLGSVIIPAMLAALGTAAYLFVSYVNRNNLDELMGCLEKIFLAEGSDNMP